MRVLIFTILAALLLPLILLGYLIFFWRIRRVFIPQNISGTANEPYGGRLYMHVVGTRSDGKSASMDGRSLVSMRLFWDCTVRVVVPTS